MNHHDQLRDVSICIVGPHRMQNELIAYFLGRVTGIECVVKHDIENILSKGNSTDGSVRLVLLDYDGRNLYKLLAKLNAGEADIRSVTLPVIFNISNFMGVEQKWLKNGVRGFFYKGDPMSILLSGIRHICAGELWISRELMTRMILKSEKRKNLLRTTNLTLRQVEILNLLAGGVSNKEISEKLCISTNTVRTHLYGIFQTINVSSRHQAVEWLNKNSPSLIQKY